MSNEDPNTSTAEALTEEVMSKFPDRAKFDQVWAKILKAAQNADIELTKADELTLLHRTHDRTLTDTALFEPLPTADSLPQVLEAIRNDHELQTNLNGYGDDYARSLSELAEEQSKLQAEIFEQRKVKQYKADVLIRQAVTSHIPIAASGSPMTMHIKLGILKAETARQDLSRSILAGGIGVAEAKQNLGNDGWKLPLFIGNAQLDLHGEEVAGQFGIAKGTPAFDEFIKQQRSLNFDRYCFFNPQ